MASGSRDNSGPNSHSDFLTFVSSRRALKGLTQRPAPLSAQEHAAHRKHLQGVHFIKPKYSDEHEINVAGIFGKWKRYCAEKDVGDWKTTLEGLRRETAMDFFLFVCETYNIRSWGTSKVYMRQFQELYTTVTGRFMDRNDSKEVYKYHDRVLIPRFGLRPPNIDGKPVVSAAELRVIVTFNMAYDTTVFPCERQRIQLWACYQFLVYTGARPAELVDGERARPKNGSLKELFGKKAVMLPEEEDEDDPFAPDEASKKINGLLVQETEGRGRPKALCYEDIIMMMVHHPETGQTIPAMAIKFVHHKGCDRKPKPTIFFFTPTKKLAFCAVSVIIALALHDEAFAAPSLTNATSVLETRNQGGAQSTPLRWKDSMLKVPVFRRFDRDGKFSGNQAMPYAALRDGMKQQSLDAGYEQHWTPRFCRRGAANSANGNASDAVRDQMMRHDPKFATFQDAYLNARVEFDMQNTFLGEQTEDQLYKLFAHVSLTRDPRATRDLVPKEVWANQQQDPEIVELKQRRAALKAGAYQIQGRQEEPEIRQLTDTIRLKRAQRERQIVKDYREYYFYNRPTWDIERQARGEPDQEYMEPTIKLNISERAKLADILCNQPEGLKQDEMLQKRIEAIDLAVALCSKRETRKRSRNNPRFDATPIKEEFPEPEIEPSADLFPLLLDARQCPDCFGDERLTMEERTFRYCRTTIRDDHFDDHHLCERERAVHRGEAIRCEHPKCRTLKFEHLDHFRNHVATVHGVPLRCSEQVKQRRQKKAKRRQMTKNKTSRT